MSPLNFDIGLANLGCGLTVLVLTAALMFRHLGSASATTSQAFVSVRRFWGEKFAVWAVVLLAVGTLALFLPMSDRPTLAMALAVAPLALIVPCVEAFRLSRLISLH